MRKILRYPLVVSALVGLTAMPAAAHTSHGDTDTDDTLTLYAVEEDAIYITRQGEVIVDEEAVPATPAQGDGFLSTDALYEDEERTELVGRNHIECTVTEVVGELPTEELEDPDDYEDFRTTTSCSGVVQLFGQGTLTWSGAATFSLDDLLEEIESGYDFDEPFITVAITGGTQELIGANGQVDVFDEEAPTEDEVWTRYEVQLT